MTEAYDELLNTAENTVAYLDNLIKCMGIFSYYTIDQNRDNPDDPILHAFFVVQTHLDFLQKQLEGSVSACYSHKGSASA
ncbi:MAG: hypothetical protein IJ461_00060 [Clostridia bacterium]|nr:hypothetical protein [Clostridia bacterium]